MNRPDDFLAGKAKVMGVSAEDFPPLSKMATGCSSDQSASKQSAEATTGDSPCEQASLSQPCWKSLFGSDPPPELEYCEPELCDGEPLVKISTDICDQGSALWEDSLIGQFQGTPPPLYQIQSVAYNLWGRYGGVDVLVWENESFIFKFGDLETKQWVLANGPWFISQKPLFLSCWRPGPIEKISLKKVPMWIKLWGVPLELFSLQGIGR